MYKPNQTRSNLIRDIVEITMVKLRNLKKAKSEILADYIRKLEQKRVERIKNDITNIN